MDAIATGLDRAAAFLERVEQLNARYRAGEIRTHVPERLRDGDEPLESLVATLFPLSARALDAASNSLFYSLPVAFEPGESVGPYLAIVDRDEAGEPYRFLDMGALIATHAFGENDPAVVRAVLDSLPFVTDRYAHSEYQTVLSLRLKAALDRIAPAGTPRHFVVNTGAEAVENAIKAVLMNRVMTAPDGDGGFIVSFDGAFHGRTLGALAVTHRKKARLGFPTFDWPHIPFPVDAANAPKETARREERSLKQLWDLLVSGRLPGAEKNKDVYRRESDALDAFLAQPGGDVHAFVTAQRSTLSPDVVRRSRRVAAVLVEPIQGEGGVRMTSALFMRKLRLLTRIYDVPLVFDEVQTGWGMTGRLWAHELFDLPCPPDVVTWAKKAQNGILFVSEALATFFQEEKKFNTTWEGDSVGMVRLLAQLDQLDLEQVRRTGDLARRGLETLAREFREIVKNVRGAGVMLAFDLVRADLRDALLDRAFRRGLILLAAGERTVRFYPRYDTTAVRDRRRAGDPARRDRGLRRRQRRPRARRPRAPERRSRDDGGAEDPPRHARHPARHDRDDGALARRLRDLQAADPERGAGTLRRRCLPGRRPPRRPPPAGAVSARDAGGDDGEPARDRQSPSAIACPDASSATRSAARSRTTTRRASAPTRTTATTTRSSCRRSPPSPASATPPTSSGTCWSRSAIGRSPTASRSSRP